MRIISKHIQLIAFSLIIFKYITCIANSINVDFNNDLRMIHNLSITIHAGPHKTGSTYIQNAFLTLNEVLTNKYNYIQPYDEKFGHIHAKMNSLFVNELFNLKATKHVRIHKMRTFFLNAYKANKHVLFSAEDLSQVSLEGLEVFNNIIKHYHPKIIIIFRDSLSRVLSNYKHTFDITCLSEETYLPDFNTYIHQLINGSISNYYPTIIEKFGSLFGFENLILIDYDGAKAAKKDLVYIILCEINQLLCNELSNGLKYFYKQENIRPYIEANKAEDHKSLVISGLYSEVRKYINQRNCTISSIGYVVANEIISKDLYVFSLVHNLTLPTKTISSMNLKSLHNEIIRYDDIIRERFKNQILYSNRQASILSVEKLIITELDIVAFKTSNLWKEFIEKVIRSLEEYLLLDCMKIISYPRRAIIHIGPDTTGLTYIQKTLFHMKDFWKLRKFLTPTQHTYKDTDRFADELLDYSKVINQGSFPQILKMKVFLKDALTTNSKIVITSDKLSLLSPIGISTLHRLIRYFDTKIFIIFRDSLTRALSKYISIIHHNPLSKLLPNMQHFRDYLNTVNYHNFYLDIINNYGIVFGIENIIIQDYHGNIEMNEDNLAIAFFCGTNKYDLFKFKINCINTIGNITNHSNLHNFDKVDNNIVSNIPSNFLTFHSLTSQMYSHIKSIGCIINHNNFIIIRSYLVKLVQNKQFTINTLPDYSINFKIMHNNTIKYDDEVRRLYHYNIVKNNRDASIRAVQKLVIKDLNTDQFRNGGYWKNWKQKVIMLLHNKNYIKCPLSLTAKMDNNTIII